jgi:hypothetical protein
LADAKAVWENKRMSSQKRPPGNRGNPKKNRTASSDHGQEESHHALAWRIFRGPALSLTGVGLMRFSFGFGVMVVYLGLLACWIEVCFEPWLLKRHFGIQIGFFVLLLTFTDVFLIGVVLRDNPIYVGYRITDTNLIALNIRNDSDDDYQDLDLTISTDGNGVYFDKLRNLSEFPVLAVVDQGWKLTHLQAALVYVDDGQYRLTRPTIRVRCAILPRHSSIDSLLSVVRGSPSGIVPATDWHTLNIQGRFVGKYFKTTSLSRSATRES